MEHRPRQVAQARSAETEGTPSQFQAGDLVIECALERVTRDGRRVPMAKLSFDLLLALVRAAPELVSTDQLMDQVWPNLIVGPETVSQRIKRLREALGDDSAEPRYIEGVRGRGYRIVVPVAPIATGEGSEPELLSSGSTQSSERHPAAATAPRPPSRAWRTPVAIGVATILGGLLLAGTVWNVRNRSSAPRPNLSSIAVLPFANLTGDSSEGYFSDGLAAELINTLGRAPDLKVPSRTSSFAYKGRDRDIRRIAADLGVGTILEGSVRSADQRVRVTAELVDAQTGFQIWSKDYDDKFEDIFALEDEITADVVQAVAQRSSLHQPASIPHAASTSDPEAYRLLLQGEGVELGSFDLARSFFDRAIERDPRFARALVDRAATYLYEIRLGMPVTNALDRAEGDIARALALEPRMSQAHGALGFLSELRGDWVQAQTSFREATTLADLAVELGMAKNAAPLPLVYAAAAESRGRFDDAARLATSSLRPALQAAGAAEVMQLVYASHSDAARKPAARRALSEFVHRVELQADPLSRLQLLGSFIEVDALDDAFGLAERTLDEFGRVGMVGVPWGLLWTARSHRFREDPRFQDLVRRLGMPVYWRKYGPPDGCTLTGNRLNCS